VRFAVTLISLSNPRPGGTLTCSAGSLSYGVSKSPTQRCRGFRKLLQSVIPGCQQALTFAEAAPKCQLSKNAAGVLHHLVEMAGCPAYVTESARFRSGTANATPNHMCVFPQLPSMYNVCHRQTLGMYNVCHRQTLGPSTMSATGRR
jgi:hypothetical protein